VHDIEVAHLNVTGAPLYGIFMRNVTNVVLGQIDMRLSRGLGVRIDNRGDTSQWTRNVRIDNVYVSGASSHAVETYGVDGITIGSVTARGVGESGLLLNQTVNATVGTVDAENAGSGTGYAARVPALVRHPPAEPVRREHEHHLEPVHGQQQHHQQRDPHQLGAHLVLTGARGGTPPPAARSANVPTPGADPTGRAAETNSSRHKGRADDQSTEAAARGRRGGRGRCAGGVADRARARDLGGVEPS